jgi:hypothetical protein
LLRALTAAAAAATALCATRTLRSAWQRATGDSFMVT